MADKDIPNNDNNVGSPEKGEKSKGSKGKKKGKSRGHGGHAAADTTSSPLSESGRITSASGVNILLPVNNNEIYLNGKVRSYQIFII